MTKRLGLLFSSSAQSNWTWSWPAIDAAVKFFWALYVHHSLFCLDHATFTEQRLRRQFENGDKEHRLVREAFLAATRYEGNIEYLEDRRERGVELTLRFYKKGNKPFLVGRFTFAGLRGESRAHMWFAHPGGRIVSEHSPEVLATLPAEASAAHEKEHAAPAPTGEFLFCPECHMAAGNCICS